MVIRYWFGVGGGGDDDGDNDGGEKCSGCSILLTLPSVDLTIESRCYRRLVQKVVIILVSGWLLNCGWSLLCQ